MTDRGGEQPGSDRFDVGSVSEEAAKLLGALQDWARESGAGHARSTGQSVADALGSLGEHVGNGQDCRYCPLCQALRLVRETSPEVRENLAVAVGALAQAATAALRAPGPRGDSASRPDHGPRPVDLDDD